MSFNLTSLFGIRKKIINVAEEHQQKYNLQGIKGKNRYDKKVFFFFFYISDVKFDLVMEFI